MKALRNRRRTYVNCFSGDNGQQLGRSRLMPASTTVPTELPAATEGKTVADLVTRSELWLWSATAWTIHPLSHGRRLGITMRNDGE